MAAVTGDVTYTAQFDKQINSDWLNIYSVIDKGETIRFNIKKSGIYYRGLVLKVYLDHELVKDVNEPNHSTSEPDRYYTATQKCTVSLVAKTIDAPSEYTLYLESLNTVTWQNEDGTLLETDTDVVAGTTPTYDGETPTKAEDSQYTYTFAGWSPAVTDVTGDVTYTATYTATEKMQPVAEVNGTQYATLEEAIAAAQNGDTITLLDDITGNFTIPAGLDVSLDLNAHTIAASNTSTPVITNRGTLNVYGGTLVNNGLYFPEFLGDGGVAVMNYGVATVNVTTNKGAIVNRSTSSTTPNLTVAGGTYVGNPLALSSENNSYTVINGGNFTGGSSFVRANSGATTEVNDGNFACLGTESESNWIVNGGNVNAITVDGGSEDISITVNGGEIKELPSTSTVNNSTNVSVEVSGGTFNSVVPEEYCAEGFKPVTTPDAQGKYTVEPSGANNGVSLTIGKDITSNYYVDYTAYAGATKVVYTYNSISEQECKEATTDTVYLDDIPAAMLEGGRLKITVAQAPAQMAETTEIKIMNADEVLDTLNYSSKTYCDNIIAMDDDALAEYAGTAEKAAQLKTLCNTIIAYGYAAQGVFADYETTAITTADFSTAVKNQIDAAWCDSRPSAANAGQIRFTSVSFACTKDARLRFYMDTSAATYTPEAPAEESGHNTAIKYIVKDGVKQYFIEVSGIDAVDFDKPMVVNYGGSSISCSVLDFCGLAFTYGDTPVQDLARTLIVYNQNAEAYFG